MNTWKVVSIVPVMIGLFVAVACQDQVADDLNTVVQNSSAALDVPPNIQARYDELKKANPNSNYIMIEMREEGQEKIAEMEKKYGLPTSIEVFQLGEEQYEKTGTASIRGEADSGITIQHSKDLKNDNEKRAIAIIEYNSQVDALAKQTAQDGEIFTLVEETAQPKQGMENYYSFITSNMKYPKEAKEQGIEGKVFVEFVIEKDGSLTNLKVLKGIGHGCDDEAMRVLAMSPPWNPARQRSLPVRQRMVMPIVFSAGQATTGSIESRDEKMIIETGPVQKVNGKMLLTGQVKDEEGNPIKGANVVAKGQTYGTVTDENGKFQLPSDKKISLVVSFVGYKSEEIVHAYDKYVY
jgi:TonB family protein